MYALEATGQFLTHIPCMYIYYGPPEIMDMRTRIRTWESNSDHIITCRTTWCTRCPDNIVLSIQWKIPTSSTPFVFYIDNKEVIYMLINSLLGLCIK